MLVIFEPARALGGDYGAALEALRGRKLQSLVDGMEKRW
jgi:hypothetical protein